MSAQDLSGEHDPGVHIRVVQGRAGGVGRITLDRPKALNAVTPAGVRAIAAALAAWEADDAIALVLIDGAGERAFCAGGDVQAIHRAGVAGDLGFARSFWAEEYRLNAAMARYRKPLLSLMDGVTMGGGVGLSAHASLRLVTDRSVVAMPEAAIGLLPDAGGLWLLSRAPGALGAYLGMTGARMGPGDAIHAGFADRYLPGSARAAATEALEAEGAVAALDPFLAAPPPAALAADAAEITRIFSAPDPRAILDALGAVDAGWAEKAAAALRRNAPRAVAGARRGVALAQAAATIEDALRLEYRFNWRILAQGDFLEGIRALVIDKDKAPRWRPDRLDALAPADTDAMFASLGSDELRFDVAPP